MTKKSITEAILELPVADRLSVLELGLASLFHSSKENEDVWFEEAARREEAVSKATMLARKVAPSLTDLFHKP